MLPNKSMRANIYCIASTDTINRLLTLSRASMLAPRWQSRATTSEWPLAADVIKGVSPPYPRQREEYNTVL